MEFIICDSKKNEIGKMKKEIKIDFDIGKTNDVEISCEKGVLDFGMYLISPGTEYGALIEELDSWTDEKEEKWMGNAFRKFLQEFIIEPPEGQDYKIVEGDAHVVMRQILNGAFDNLFTIPEESSGIKIENYQFDRYTDALAGFTKMLIRKNARINIEIKQGGSNEPFSVVLSAVPIQNLSSEIEYSQDSKIAINLRESRRGINHLICLGKGELKNRQVVHLYAQLDGSVSKEKYYTGLKERTAIYDLSNAESMEELRKSGEDRLKELMGAKTMRMTAQSENLQIGDIIAGRNYENGMYLQKPIVQKIVRVENGTIEIQHKVEGEE